MKISTISLFLIIFLSVSFLSVYAVISPTWNPAATVKGYKPLDLGVETDVTTPSQNDVSRCWAFSGLGNMTIDSIQGSIKMAKIGNLPKSDKTQGGVVFYVSPNLIQSEWSSNTRYTTKQCTDSLGNPATLSTFDQVGAERIGSSVLILVGQNSTNIGYQLNNINIYIPQGWYLIEVLGGDSNTYNVNGTLNIEPQLHAYLK